MLRALFLFCTACICSGLVRLPMRASPRAASSHSLAQAPKSRTAALRMQEEQEQTLEQAVTMGRSAIDSLIGMLAEGEDPPDSLKGLKSACDEAADAKDINLKMYLVLIDQALNYKVNEETGTMSRVELDFNNREDEQVASKMAYCYEYGIKMFMRGLLKEDDLKQVVLEQLAGKVGLDGPAFDQWLGTPAVV